MENTDTRITEAARDRVKDERNQTPWAFNNTQVPYPREKTVVDLFDEQAALTPDNVAVYAGGRAVTYSSLHEKANQLARHLLAMGVMHGDNVGLMVGRNLNMVTGLLAILKCGAAYVPIEPEHPEDRRTYMLRQSAVTFVVTEDAAGPAGFECISLATVPYNKYSAEPLPLRPAGDQLAYTIYTSGSTGVPKGVMIAHHSVVNLITWVNKQFNVGEGDRLLFVTSMCFDLSVYDIFGMLAAGGTIVMASKDEVLNVSRLAELIVKYRITFWDSVPTTLEFLVNRLAAEQPELVQRSLRLAFLSGDWIPLPLADKVRKFFPNVNVISLGGATECTVWSNFFPIGAIDSAWKSIPYGRPISNNSFYILDEELKPVPDGETGELFIGGVGVAHGYANDPERTSKAFLPDPFTDEWGGVMYRTGDLGRMMDGGIMEFVGRKDTQVKIRGFRVELGEIEAVLRQCPTVTNAVVLFDPSKAQLSGYVVPGQCYDRDTVIAHLKSKVPEYMVPSRWIELDQLPLSSNGKIDKKAMQLLDAQDTVRSEFVAPSTSLEKTLAAIWKQVLATDCIGIHDNFFDLGGQSLLAVELITEMEKATGKPLPVNILYKHATIAAMAEYIQQGGEQRKKTLIAVKPTGTKMPLYIVQGDGLSLSNFHNLGRFVDEDQPVYSLQPIGLDGTVEPPESIGDIARYYIEEIIAHNPDGPYALAGYSFGGYVSIEMRKQLEAMGKSVKMIAIFDTDATNAIYKKDWVRTIPLRIKRQIPKFLFIARSMFTQPVSTVKYQYTVLSRKIKEMCYSLGVLRKPELKGVSYHLDKINETHLKAFRNYHLTTFNDKIYLFKASTRMYFVDDFEYLGWANYALKGVSAYSVPGDHNTMFQPPNVSKLARLLQHALDNC